MLTKMKNKYEHVHEDIWHWKNDKNEYDQAISRAEITAQNAVLGPVVIMVLLVLGTIMSVLGINLTEYTDSQLENFSDPMVDPAWLYVILPGASVAWFVLGRKSAKRHIKSAQLKYQDSITKMNEYEQDMAYVKHLKTQAHKKLKEQFGIDANKVFGGVTADSIAQDKIATMGIDTLISGIKNNKNKDIASAKKHLGVVKPEILKEHSRSLYIAGNLTPQQQQIFKHIMQQVLQNKK